ncbi:MAG: DUF4189 domain-containing protein [Pseudomonadota bacterium]
MKKPVSFLFSMALAISSVAVIHQSASAADEVYECDAIGDGQYIVTIPENASHTAFAVYRLSAEYGGNAEEGTRLELREGEQYIGQGLIFSFHGSNTQLNDLGSNMIVSCYRPAGTQNHGTGALGGNEVVYNGAPAQSLGGKVRGGPGTNFGQIGSLSEGAAVSVIANTGVQFDGYDWFEIRFNGRTGYQWGGIMCSEGTQLPGIYQQCGSYSQSSTSQSSNTGGTWMAFAIGNDGRLGHGAGTNRNQAQEYALQFCGHGSCQIENETQALCHAAAETPGGFWFGAADSKQQAERFALNFCSQAGASCTIRYSFCR